MKEQKTTKWSNFNPLCLARHVLRNLWMTVLAGLICVMAVYLLQTLVSKPSYDSQVTFAVTSRSASATASCVIFFCFRAARICLPITLYSMAIAHLAPSFIYQYFNWTKEFYEGMLWGISSLISP